MTGAWALGSRGGTAASEKRCLSSWDPLLDAVELDPQPSPRCSRDLLQSAAWTVVVRPLSNRAIADCVVFIRAANCARVRPARVRALISAQATSFSGPSCSYASRLLRIPAPPLVQFGKRAHYYNLPGASQRQLDLPPLPPRPGVLHERSHHHDPPILHGDIQCPRDAVPTAEAHFPKRTSQVPMIGSWDEST